MILVFTQRAWRTLVRIYKNNLKVLPSMQPCSVQTRSGPLRPEPTSRADGAEILATGCPWHATADDDRQAARVNTGLEAPPCLPQRRRTLIRPAESAPEPPAAIGPRGDTPWPS